MKSFRFLLMVCIYYCLPLVTTDSVLVQLPQNTNASSLTLPNNPIANVTAPSPPRGFKANVVLDTSAPLLPPAVYVNAIKAAASWTEYETWSTRDLSWDLPVTGTQTVSLAGYNVQIVFETTQPASSATPCKLSYVLLGLNQAVLQMTNEKKYFAATITLTMQGIAVGSISIKKTTVQIIAANSTTALNADSGQIIDPSHDWFHINWRVTGEQVGAIQIFTAVLDGIIKAAAVPDQTAEVDNSVYGVSASRSLAIIVYESRPDQRARLLNYALVIRALQLITMETFVKERKFAECAFDMTWSGFEFAVAYVYVELDGVVANSTLAVER